MRAITSTQNCRTTTSLAALTLALIALGVLLWSPGQNSHAQQDRQLQQTGSANANGVKRIALVIGNGAYTKAPPLKNPPNDARDMAVTLRTLGFDVTSGINTNQRDMKRLIREFGQKLKNGGSGLFYYAGHGVQSKGRNYLVPVDADIQSEAEVEDSGVDASLVLNYMDDAQNGLNIVILDACRNNPFARSFRSATDGLAQVDAPTGTLIAYATAPGRVASDGTGQNGLYTSELLKQMRVPGLSATEMFMRVRAEVMRQTANKQVPWEASSLVGSFYFSGSRNDGTTSSLPANEVKVDPLAFELSYWETIKNSNNADDFKAYLEKYPSGQFASLAKNRINSLDAPAKPAESRTAPANDSATELAFWDAVKTSTSAGDYRAYLQKYPNGAFVELAKNRLAPLEAAEKERAKGDEMARNAKSFKGAYVLRGATLASSNPGTLIVTPNRIQFVYDDVDTNKSEGTLYKPHVFQCSELDAAKLDDVFVREIRDGQYKMRFEAESAGAASDALAAMKFVCAHPGANFPGATAINSATEPSAIDPNAKVFAGYFGIMSAGFSARPGKMVIAASGIQFVWDKGTAGIADNNKTVDYKLHPDPAPTLLQCSYFTAARIDGFFIREINTNNPAALVEVTGWGGAVLRFRASSAAEAAATLAAVRDACKSQPK